MVDALHILVIDRAGQRHRLPALEGYRVMEIIRDWGQDIRAECSGSCACAPCHVWVGDAWIDRLPPPGDEENDRLDDAFEVGRNSRLSRQIIMTAELYGLEVSLAPGTELEKRVA